MTAPPAMTVTGTASGLFGNLSGGTALTETALYGTAVTFVSNVPADHVVVWESRLIRVPPIVGYFAPDGTLKRDGDPVKLLANDVGLNVSGLQWTCIINGIEEFTFDADGDVDLSSVVNVPNVPVVGTPFTEASIIALLANTSSPIREALDTLYGGGGIPDDGSVTFAKLAAALVVTSSETIGSNNNNTTVPTSAAVVAYVSTQFAALVAGAPGALDTWLEVVAAIQSDESGLATLTTLINTKAPLNSPAFTGTPTGITKNHVGLGNVDNTADASKPVSALQSAAIAAAQAAAIAASQPSDADLTAIAALTTTIFGRSVLTQADGSSVRALIGEAPVFSTADYAAISGNDRPRVASAVAAAVAAMTATGKDQTVLIHGPLAFTSGVTKAALGTSADPNNQAYGNQGVPIPVNLAHTLNIVYAPSAKITLSTTCVNAFYADKLADYDVAQNINFFNAWTDGASLTRTNESHALFGNYCNYDSPLMYMSFQNINFFGKTLFTNMPDDPAGVHAGQPGIALLGHHAAPLEATQTFTKNIYLEDGEYYGGAGLFNVMSQCAIRPGGVNHLYDNIEVGRWSCVAPSVRTAFGAYSSTTGIYITAHGFGSNLRIGPGYCENIGDDAIEIGTMQNVLIERPVIKNPFSLGIMLRHTHAPIDVESQRIVIHDPKVEWTTALTSITGACGYPIRIYSDDVVLDFSSTATGGTFTITVPGLGTTTALAWNASRATITAALVALGATSSKCTGAATLNVATPTSPLTVWISRVNLDTAVTTTSSLTGGALTTKLSASNASFGNIIIENPTWKAAGLSNSKQSAHVTQGIFVHGLDQPHRKVEIVRPRVIWNNYTYDNASDGDISLYYPAAPYVGWGHFVLRDHHLALTGACDFKSLAGQGNLFEVNANGQGIVEIDGMTNDRINALNGSMFQVVAVRDNGVGLQVAMRRLFPKTKAAAQVNGGVKLYGATSGGTVAQFDLFDSNFSLGTNSATSNSLDLSGAGAANTAIARAARNIYPLYADVVNLDAKVNAQTGTTYTFAATDDGGIVTANNASAQTYTVPQDSDAAIPIGAYIEIHVLGAGQVTFAQGTGATLNARGAALKSNGQYAVIGLRKRAANTFTLAGDLTP